MTTTSSRHATTFRHDAHVLAERDLSAGQSRAAEDLLGFLEDALARSSELFEKSRRNHVLLLDGERGSGKSSVIHTLRAWMDPSQNARRHAENLELTAFDLMQRRARWLEPVELDPLPPGANLVAAILARIAQATDASRDIGDRRERRDLMDPSATNRITNELENLRMHAVKALEGNTRERRGGVDPDAYSIHVGENERQRVSLQSKLNRVLGLSLAGSTRNAEHERGVYVLPIEDVDMRPARAAEVLGIAYMLSVPRLVFLLVGQARMLDEMLNFSYEREFAEVAKSTDEIVQRRVVRYATTLSSSSFRKMLPLAQRIVVGSLTAVEAMNRVVELRGANGAAHESTERNRLSSRGEPPRLGDLLHEIKVNPTLLSSGASTGGLSLRDLMAVPFYTGNRVLRAPPRDVVELAQGVAWSPDDGTPRRTVDSRLPTAPDAPSPEPRAHGTGQPDASAAGEAAARDKGDQFVDKLRQLYIALIDEDPHLNLEIQDRLKECVERIDEHHAGLESSDVGEAEHATWELAPPEHCRIVVDPADGATTPVGTCFGSARAEVRIGRADGHHVHVGDARLGEHSHAALGLLHDALRLRFARGIVTRPLAIEKIDQLAGTSWSFGLGDSYFVPWFSGRWPTFLHLDTFIHLWDRGAAGVLGMSDNASEVVGPAKARLALYAAVDAIVRTVTLSRGQVTKLAESALDRTRIAAGAPPVPLPSTPFLVRKPIAGKNDEHTRAWIGASAAANLVELLGDVRRKWSERANESRLDLRTTMYEDALVDLACLLAPECSAGFWSAPSPTSHNVDSELKTALFSKLDLSSATAQSDLTARLRRRIFERRLARLRTIPSPLHGAVLLGALPKEVGSLELKSANGALALDLAGSGDGHPDFLALAGHDGADVAAWLWDRARGLSDPDERGDTTKFALALWRARSSAAG